MCTPGNKAKPRAIHSNIQTVQSSPVPGWERTYNALVSTPLSQHSNSLCQPDIKFLGTLTGKSVASETSFESTTDFIFILFVPNHAAINGR